MKKKSVKKLWILAILVVFLIICLVAVIKFTGRNETVDADVEEEVTVQEDTAKQEDTAVQEDTAKQEDTAVQEDTAMQENTAKQEETTAQVDSEQSNQELTEEEAAGQSDMENVPFDMANPIPDTTYTGIVAYEAKEELTADSGLAKAEVIVTMPQLTMRSVEASKINEDLLKFYTEEFEQGLENAKEDRDYQNELDKEETEPFHYDYSYEAGYGVTLFNEKYLSILANGYEYAGGAHGMPFRTELIYNLETGERVKGETLFALTDAQVQSLKVEAYKELFEKSEKGEYWEDALSIVESSTGEDSGYYLTDKGVTFYYYPYALAPYAAGFVEVTVPYEKLPLK